MKFINLIILSALVFSGGCALSTGSNNPALEITTMYCNGSDDPVVGTAAPEFGWTLHGSGTNRKQSAYQVIVATSESLLTPEQADVWNSGKTVSDRSQWIKYAGKALAAGKTYYWKVGVWDEKGQTPGFSRTASFSTAPGIDPMGAHWISDSVYTERDNPGTSVAPLFRKTFVLESVPEHAVLRYSGAGYIDMYANGSHCSDAVLQPSFTRYDKRIGYNTSDIKSLLKKGENVLACMAGNGFYNVDTRSAWWFNRAPWRNRPAVICSLELTWADGRKQIVSTDHTWKTAPGPVTFNQVRNGESFDARLAVSNWNQPGFDDSSWQNAPEVKGPGGRLVPEIIPPMRRIRYVKAVSITEPSPGIYLFDFGQNLTGWTRLKFKGLPGREIIIRHGERIDSTGRLDQKELSRFIFTGETQTSRYTCNDNRPIDWEPRFVYYGFRYAEVTGLAEKPGVETLQACIVHTDFKPAGELRTGNHILDRLHENTLWSYLGNFHSIPEDCPHREKMGWTGDGQLVAGTGMLNFYTYNGYRKWLNDFTDEQQPDGNLPGIIPTSGWGYTYGRDPKTRDYGYGPQWEGACITIPWKLYLNYGDSSLLSNYYPMMKRYMDWLGSIAVNGLLDIGIDDHKSLVKSDPGVISTAYYYLLSEIMANVAGITGREADAGMFADLKDRIAKAYSERYLNGSTGDLSFLSIALATGFDMLPPGKDSIMMEEMARRIREQNFHVYTGVVGTNAVFSALVRKGYKDLFLRVVTNPEYPSYANWINEGATTLWQNWDGSQSRNHIMFGFVDEYMYDVFMGLRNADKSCGYKRFVLQPDFEAGMNDVYTKHASLYGDIESGWKRDGKVIEWKVSVPVNTEATLVFPDKAMHIKYENHDFDQTVLSNVEGKKQMKLGSGQYIVKFQL